MTCSQNLIEGFEISEPGEERALMTTGASLEPSSVLLLPYRQPLAVMTASDTVWRIFVEQGEISV